MTRWLRNLDEEWCTEGDAEKLTLASFIAAAAVFVLFLVAVLTYAAIFWTWVPVT